MSELYCTVCSGLMACRGTNNATTCGLQCPYNTGKTSHCIDKLMDCALALIQRQKARIDELEAARTPRLLTLDEAKAIQTCWIEYDEMIFPAIYYCQGNDKRFSIFIVNAEDDLFEDYCEDLTDNEIWLENVFMNQLWRCWTQRPTDAQRKAVPWNE